MEEVAFSNITNSPRKPRPINNLTPSSRRGKRPQIFPVKGYKTALKNVPDFDEKEVVQYYKSLTKQGKHMKRSYKFLVEGYVDLEALGTVEEQQNNVTFIRCKVYKSTKKTEKPYTVNIAISIPNSQIIDSYCACPVGKGGFCNHVVSVLKSIVLLKSKKYEEPPSSVSCTDMPQQWSRRRNTIGSYNVLDVDWQSPKESAKQNKVQVAIKAKLYDPRRNKEKQSLAQGVQKFYSALSNAENVLFSSTLESNKEILEESELINNKLCKTPKGFYLKYQQSFNQSGMEYVYSIQKFGISETILLVPNAEIRYPCFEDDCIFSISGTFLLLGEKEYYLLEKTLITKEEGMAIEKNTRAQSDSERCRIERKFRISSSNFGKVVKRVQEWTIDGIKNVILPKDLSRVRAIQYGRNFENVAVLRYESFMRGIGHFQTIFDCGFVIPVDKPWLGTSPDRVVFDPMTNPNFGLLEIKCPYKYKDYSPEDAIPDKFYVLYANCIPQLSKKHEYYYQVQGQMGITGLKFCDFAVYLSSGLIVCRVEFDKEFWNNMQLRLD